MELLEIACYFLISLADAQMLLGIVLTLTAVITDRQLCQRSNIMIPFLLLPDIVRTILMNLHVVESLDPGLWYYSDTTCVVVWFGFMSCYSGALWLLMVISVHRYFLCVRMRSGIDSTKISVVTSILTLVISMSVVEALGIGLRWDIISNDMAQANALEKLQNAGIENLSSVVEKEFTASDLSETFGVINGSIACMHREDMTYLSRTARVASGLIFIIPMIIQIYFYSKINQHLKRQQERFKSNQQVKHVLSYIQLYKDRPF